MPRTTIGENVITLELEQARAPVPAAERRSRRGQPRASRSSGTSSDISARMTGLCHRAGVYDRLIREVERPLIARALAATRGNQLKAADVLGLNRNTLRKKIRDLDIHVSRAP